MSLQAASMAPYCITFGHVCISPSKYDRISFPFWPFLHSFLVSALSGEQHFKNTQTENRHQRRLLQNLYLQKKSKICKVKSMFFYNTSEVYKKTRWCRNGCWNLQQINKISFNTKGESVRSINSPSEKELIRFLGWLVSSGHGSGDSTCWKPEVSPAGGFSKKKDCSLNRTIPKDAWQDAAKQGTKPWTAALELLICY